MSGGFWAEAPLGAVRPPEMVALSGLERMRAYATGRLTDSPLGFLTGVTLLDVSPGAAEYRMPLSAWLGEAAEGPGLGALCVLADATVGGAVQTMLEPGRLMATISLTLHLVDEVPTGSTCIGRGKVIENRDGVASADGTLSCDGRIVARARTRCVFLEAPIPDGAAASAAAVFDAAATDRDPHADDTRVAPYRRPLEGDPAPLHRLTGIETRVREDGVAEASMPASGWLASATGGMQGGVAAWLGERAIDVAASRIVDELTCNFLRPVSLGEGELRAEARIIHQGRRRGTATAVVLGPQGKAVAALLAGIDATAPCRGRRSD